MKKKIILITVFHSFISKNILNTDVFDILKSNKNLSIVLAVPKPKEKFFLKIYASDNVSVVGIDVPSAISKPSSVFFSRLSNLLIDSHYLWYKRAERLDSTRTIFAYTKYFVEQLFVKIFSPFRLSRIILRYGFVKKGEVKSIKKVFEEIHPDILFATDVFDEMDVLFMREARSRNIKLMGMVRSWDNCYSKGVMRVVPDNLIVNNLEIKKEAIILHDISAEKIYVGGLPQFDASKREVRTNREEFFKDIGADPNKKLIFFGPAGSILSDTDWQIAEIVRRAISYHRLPPTQVFVSNHPNHPADFSKFKNDGSFIFATLGKVFSENAKDTELTNVDTKRLRDLIYYADVIVYVASTVGIDSLQFDKPQIIIDFDGWEKKPYIKSVRRYHDEDHMKKMLVLGGVTVVMSENELIDAINKYFKNPSWNKDGRDHMRKQQFHNLDGKAGKRVGNYLISILKN